VGISGEAMPGRRPTHREILRVHLLGRLEVRAAEGTLVRLGGRHAPALFALMVLTRRPRTRETIAADLWPDADGTSVGSLRQALWLVRHGLIDAGVDPDSVLDITPESVGIRPEARLDVDAATFERWLDEGDSGIERAVEMYRGDLVEALAHECFATERERLADRFEDALVAVAQHRLRDGDSAGARVAAERVLARDPLREEAHAVLISVLGLIGSRSQVVRQYRRLQAVLERELGETPLPETDAAYRLAMVQVVRRSLERAAELEPEHPPTLVALGR
jgi:DNA-binding SARP family transcriptional activator